MKVCKIQADTIADNTPYIYVVHAMRWGNPENHSYIVTASYKPDMAIKSAESEEIRRGGKYGCEVVKCMVGRHEIIRKPYDGKVNCYNCANFNPYSDCSVCKNFSRWEQK